MKYLFFIILILTVLFNCEKKREIAIENKYKEIIKNIEKDSLKLKLSQTYNFRRNYFGQENLQGKKLEEFENRNPDNLGSPNSHFYDKGLINLNLFANDGSIILKNFKDVSNKTGLKTKLFRKIYNCSLKSHFNPDKSYYVFIVRDDKQNVLLNKIVGDNFQPDYKYMIADVDNDNQDELLELYQWYISNGDNFDLSVYEIEKN